MSDGKAQITGTYTDAKMLMKINTFTVCYQNTEEDREKTDMVIRGKILALCDEFHVPVDRILINPTGKFLIGGFEGDAGLTGRKIVVDSYEGFAPVGGGAFSGKDPSKVDRTGAYKAREIAVEWLKNHPQSLECTVQLSYAIGMPRPLAIYIRDENGQQEVPDYLFEECKVQTMIEDLRMKKMRFEETAKFGHFA